MKKIFLTIVFTILFTLFAFNISNANNNVQTAENINLEETKNHLFTSNEYEYYYRFVPKETGYYEVSVFNFVEDSTYIAVTDSKGNEMAFEGWNQYYNDCTAIALLNKNETYYFEIDLYTDYDVNAKVMVANHKHVVDVEKEKSYVDENEDYYNYAGFVEEKCLRCDYDRYTSIPQVKSIKLKNTSYTYTGKVQKPEVVVTDSKGKTIASSNYTVTYLNNNSRNVGRYTVSIIFKDNYEGRKTLTYDIKPKGTKLSKLKKASKAFIAKWNKQKTKTTGYQIQYSTNSKFKRGNKTITISKNKTTSKKVKSLKKNKKYYVRIRTYKTVKVNGKNVKIYSNWSKSKNVKIK